MPPLKRRREPNTTVEQKQWVVRKSEEHKTIRVGCPSIVTPEKSPNFSITYFRDSPDSHFTIYPHFAKCGEAAKNAIIMG